MCKTCSLKPIKLAEIKNFLSKGGIHNTHGLVDRMLRCYFFLKWFIIYYNSDHNPPGHFVGQNSQGTTNLEDFTSSYQNYPEAEVMTMWQQQRWTNQSNKTDSTNRSTQSGHPAEGQAMGCSFHQQSQVDCRTHQGHHRARHLFHIILKTQFQTEAHQIKAQKLKPQSAWKKQWTLFKVLLTWQAKMLMKTLLAQR